MKNLVWCLFLPACVGTFDSNPPQKTPYFPISLAQDGDSLAVVSNNADKRFSRGSVLLIDLQAVDLEIDKNSANGTKVVFVGAEKVVQSSAFISSLAQEANFVHKNSASSLLITGRGSNSILNLGKDGQKLFCEGGASNSVFGLPCQDAPNYVYVDSSKAPFFVRTSQTGEGVVGYLFEAERHRYAEIPQFQEIQIFSLSDDGKNIALGQAFSLAQIAFDKELGPLADAERDAAKKAREGEKEQVLLGDVQIVEKDLSEAYLFVSFEQSEKTSQVGGVGKRAKILWVPLAELRKQTLDLSKVGIFDLTKDTGAIATRGLDVQFDKKTGNFRILSALRSPNALAKIGLKPTSLTAVLQNLTADICDLPAKIQSSTSLPVAFVTCEGSGGALISVDANSLKLNGQDNRFGRGPYALLLDERLGKERLYVAYWLDGTLGVFDIKNLNPIARIFSPAASNQEGGAI